MKRLKCYTTCAVSLVTMPASSSWVIHPQRGRCLPAAATLVSVSVGLAAPSVFSQLTVQSYRVLLSYRYFRAGLQKWNLRHNYPRILGVRGARSGRCHRWHRRVDVVRPDRSALPASLWSRLCPSRALLLRRPRCNRASPIHNRLRLPTPFSIPRIKRRRGWEWSETLAQKIYADRETLPKGIQQ